MSQFIAYISIEYVLGMSIVELADRSEKFTIRSTEKEDAIWFARKLGFEVPVSEQWMENTAEAGNKTTTVVSERLALIEGDKDKRNISKDQLDKAIEFLKDLNDGGCDHGVGICNCDLIHFIEELSAIRDKRLPWWEKPEGETN